jgi:hypothetical protein
LKTFQDISKMHGAIAGSWTVPLSFFAKLHFCMPFTYVGFSSSQEASKSNEPQQLIISQVHRLMGTRKAPEDFELGKYQRNRDKLECALALVTTTTSYQHQHFQTPTSPLLLPSIKYPSLSLTRSTMLVLVPAILSSTLILAPAPQSQ